MGGDLARRAVGRAQCNHMAGGTGARRSCRHVLAGDNCVYSQSTERCLGIGYFLRSRVGDGNSSCRFAAAPGGAQRPAER
jgi:hypothetical protein